MKSPTVLTLCFIGLCCLVSMEASKLPIGNTNLSPSFSPGNQPTDLNTQPSTNVFERYSSSSYGSIFPSPYWNNGGTYNSWPFPGIPPNQPNNRYNPYNPYSPYDTYNPYYPYYGGAIGGANIGSSGPIGLIGSSKPVAAKSSLFTKS